MNAGAVAASQLFSKMAAAPGGKAGEGVGEGAIGNLFLELLTALLTEGIQGTKGEEGGTGAAPLPTDDARGRNKEKGFLMEEIAEEIADLGMLLPQNIKLLGPQPALFQQSIGCSCRQANRETDGSVSGIPLPGELQAEGASLKPTQPPVAQDSFQVFASEIADFSEAEKPDVKPGEQLFQPSSQEKADLLPESLITEKMPQEPGCETRDASGSMQDNLSLSEKAPGGAIVNQQKLVFKSELLKQKALRQPVQISLKPSEGIVEGSTALQGDKQVAVVTDTLSSPGLSKEQAEAVYTKEVLKEIVEQAHLAVGRNRASLKLHLKPEFLGNLKLTISVNNGTLHARFTADNALIASLIETKLPELQHALAENGISWHQISVSVDAQSSNFASHYQNNNYQNNGSASQDLYGHGMRDEPYAQENCLEQTVRSNYRGLISAVDYLV